MRQVGSLQCRLDAALCCAVGRASLTARGLSQLLQLPEWSEVPDEVRQPPYDTYFV